MEWSVVRLATRPAGAELAGFRARALQRARTAAAPAGCVRRSHSQTLERAYRQGEPACDTVDDYLFTELAAARAWRDRLAAHEAGERVLGLLAPVLPILDGAVPAGALKHVELMRAREGMQRLDFLRYWRDVHGPLAAGIPGVLRYEQRPAADAEYATGQPELHGVAVLWFASVEALRDGARHPAFARTREDMGNFMDLAQSRSVLTQQAWSSDPG